jgi:hypothetical protein
MCRDASGLVLGGVGFAVEPVVHAPEGPPAEPFWDVGSVVGRQVSAESLLAGFNIGVVVVGGTPLARLQDLLRDLVLCSLTIHKDLYTRPSSVASPPRASSGCTT